MAALSAPGAGKEKPAGCLEPLRMVGDTGNLPQDVSASSKKKNKSAAESLLHGQRIGQKRIQLEVAKSGWLDQWSKEPAGPAKEGPLIPTSPGLANVFIQFHLK